MVIYERFLKERQWNTFFSSRTKREKDSHSVILGCHLIFVKKFQIKIKIFVEKFREKSIANTLAAPTVSLLQYVTNELISLYSSHRN